MKPIPTELRKRILDDCDSGMSLTKAAEKWNVGRSTIAKIKKQRRETGNIEPKNGKTGPKRKLESHQEALKIIVAKTPDATLVEIQEQLPIEVSIRAIHDELKILKLIYKKNSFTRVSNTDQTSRKNGRNGE
jgi:transposase